VDEMTGKQNPERVVREKTERIRRGERVVVSDSDLDKMSELDGDFMNHVASLPNPDRLGILDKYVAFKTKT